MHLTSNFEYVYQADLFTNQMFYQINRHLIRTVEQISSLFVSAKTIPKIKHQTKVHLGCHRNPHESQFVSNLLLLLLLLLVPLSLLLGDGDACCVYGCRCFVVVCFAACFSVYTQYD